MELELLYDARKKFYNKMYKISEREHICIRDIVDKYSYVV